VARSLRRRRSRGEVAGALASGSATAGCRRTRRSETVTQTGDRPGASHTEYRMIGCDVAQLSSAESGPTPTRSCPVALNKSPTRLKPFVVNHPGRRSCSATSGIPPTLDRAVRQTLCPCSLLLPGGACFQHCSRCRRHDRIGDISHPWLWRVTATAGWESSHAGVRRSRGSGCPEAATRSLTALLLLRCLRHRGRLASTEERRARRAAPANVGRAIRARQGRRHQA
jgi:hypothetical protein